EARRAWSWPAVADPLGRVAAVPGGREAEALLAVDASEGRVRTHGWVSRPDRHRSNLSGVYLFVNGRPVRDRVLQHALVDCYRDILPRGRFPSAVLFLDLPLDAVDVNVHPAKWEVRFADARAAHRWIASAVRGGIAGRSGLGGPRPTEEVGESHAPRAPRGRAEPGAPGPARGGGAGRPDGLSAGAPGPGAAEPRPAEARVRFG